MTSSALFLCRSASRPPVLEEEEVMLVTNKGKLIRLPVNGIRIAGRVTQGVTLLNTEKSERVVSVTKVKMNIEHGTDE